MFQGTRLCTTVQETLDALRGTTLHVSRRVCALAVGAIALTACGSTVQTSGSVAGVNVGQPSENFNLGSAPSAGPGQSGLTAPTNTSGSTVKVGQPAPATTTGQVIVGGTPTTAATTALGPGVDATSIHVGFTIQQNDSTVSSIASAYNVQLADNRGAYAALVNYFNAHGGVAGRKLVPVYYNYDPTSGNADQIGQAACSAFTEDSSVFAGIDTVNGSNAFNSCMQQRGRLMLQYGVYFGAEPTWQKYPNEVAADGLPLDDAGKLLADHLVGTGFLSKSTRVGVIVRSSYDMTRAYKNGFLPALSKVGLSVAQTQYVRDAQDDSDLSGYTADISSAVLKFRSSGVDRVVFFDLGSYAALVFSQNAQQQQYHPLYGFSTLNTIEGLEGSGSAAPQQQMVGSQGVSWEMNADGLTHTRTRSGKLCDAILKSGGITASDPGTEASYLKTCQTFFLFKAAADAAGRNLNRDTFIRAVEGLGSTFDSTNTWNGTTRFDANHHWGVSVYRPFVYSQKRSCFAVSGAVQPVGSA
jgi:ABC-type branched-subunit amino acid transport system substrate-binding protein